MRIQNWKAISLFSGAGGCSLGFNAAGMDIVAAFDNSATAVKTYNYNFGQNVCKNLDLSQCDFTKLRNDLNLKRGELDIILGGPPCQGFTSAGSRFWEDPRNKLVQNYAQALDSFYPRWFMMENVEGILTTAKGEYLIETLKKMISIGYSIYLKKVYIQEYGVPQRRKRVILVGNREGKKFHFPSPTSDISGSIFRHSSINLKDAIEDLESVENEDMDHIFKKENSVQQERINLLKSGQTMKDLPEYLQHNSFQKRANRRVCDGTPTEKRGGAPSGLKRLRYDEPCLTITSASINEFVHPTQNRTLTIRECARIQTFPDWFKFIGTESQKVLQIGNAIPPKFAEILAKQIMYCDNCEISNVLPNGLISFEVTKAEAMSPALTNTFAMLQELQDDNFSQLKLEGI